MIEVPSAALVADGLAEVADFFSIGTNDLVQYTLAADRTNAAVADLATALQPAVLRLIDLVVRAAQARGRHVAVCGEAAADPEVIPLLVGLGVEELSVAPGSIAAVRERVGGLEMAACRSLARAALTAASVSEVIALVRRGRRRPSPESSAPGRLGSTRGRGFARRGLARAGIYGWVTRRPPRLGACSGRRCVLARQGVPSIGRM